MAARHASEQELWIGFYKKDSNRPSVTYHEALDEALAVGWIDGVRKSLDAISYTIRFTPRTRGSYWSAVNTARAKALIEKGAMTSAGLRPFEARDATVTARYSFEQERAAFDASSIKAFKANKQAWAFFDAQPPGYRRIATFWVVSAKKDETRARRLAVLIEYSAKQQRIPLLKSPTAR